MKQLIATDKAPGAPKFLSQGIVASGLIFVSGQVHNNPDGSLVDGSTEQKLDRVMQNIQEILAAADATLDDIVKATVYVTDIALLPAINSAYPGYFLEPYPAREAVCVKALPLGAEIEISVVATTS